MFLIFITAGIICDIISLRSLHRKTVILAYCLLTVCGLAVVIMVGTGHAPPSPNDALEQILYMNP